MASQAAILSVLVNADTASATAKITEFNGRLEKAAATARKPIEARLGATFDPAGFDAYEAKVAQIERKNADRKAFKAELGANYSPQGFNAYQRAVTQAGKSQTSFSDKVKSSGKSLTSVGKSLSTYVTLPIIGVGVVAGKMSVDFQAAMERLNTQAGVSQEHVAELSAAVNNMSKSVATGPNELAAGMYHVASSLNKTLPAMKQVATETNVLKIAAEGAKVGGANLVDVTNGLDAAIVSGIKGVQNYRQAMGALNSVVGAGDMTMQNLADALGTGLLAPMKRYGLTLNQVGGALATFGDNNIRGAEAATKLASAIRIMAAPSDKAALELQSIGLGPTKLADDLRSPNGLVAALTDLKAHLESAGLTASQQNRVFTLAFGGRQSQGVQVLVSQLDRLKAKTSEVTDGANKFGDAWKKTQNTSQFKLQSALASIQSSLIKVGNSLQKLVPFFADVASGIAKVSAWFSKLSPGVRTAILVFVGILAVIGPLAVAIGALIALGPEVIAVVLGVAGVGAVLAAKWKTVEPIFAATWKVIKSVVGAVVNWLIGAWHELVNVAQAVFPTIRKIAVGVFDAIKTAVRVFVAIWKVEWALIQIPVRIAFNAVKMFWNDVLKPVFHAIASTIINTVVTSFNTMKRVVQTVGPIVGDVFTAMKNVVGKALNFILGLISTFLSGLGDLANAAASIPGVGDLFDGVAGKVNGAAAAVNHLRDVLKGVHGDASKATGGMVHARPGSPLAHWLKNGRQADAVHARPDSPLARALQRGREAEHARTASHHAVRRHTTPRAATHHVARVHTVAEPTRRVRQRAARAVTGSLPGGTQNVGSVAAADKAINAVDAKILKLERARSDATTKAQKTGLDHELAVERLRRSGLELQRTQLSESASAHTKQQTASAAAHTKQQAADKAAAAARQKAAQAALSQWLAYWSHIPSQASGQQLRLVKLQNRLTVATNDNNTAGQAKSLHGEDKLYKQWLNMDEAKLRKLNQQLARPNISGKQHRALVADKLALLQEIGTIQGDIGTTASSLTSLSSGAAGTTSAGGGGSFDLAPTGSNVGLPTALDVHGALRGGRARQETHHHTVNHNEHYNIKLGSDVDVDRFIERLEKTTGGRIHARMRSAGLRGT